MTEFDPGRVTVRQGGTHGWGADTERALVALLEVCFPGFFEGRTYFKQLPHGRFLAELAEAEAEVDGALVGQVGWDRRVIRVGDTVVTVTGLIDTAVLPGWRGRGIGRRLVEAAIGEAEKNGSDFLVLLADRYDLYERLGFRCVRPAPVRWLAVEDRRSVRVLTRDFAGELMVRPVNGRKWPEGEIDLLGYMF